MRDCKLYIHLCMAVYFLGSQLGHAIENCSKGRAPANYVPDDDLIVNPIVIEKSILDEFHQKHAQEFKHARKKIEFWIQQEQYAEDYGLEGRGIVNLPTPEQKERFLQRNYLRFLSKDVERSANAGVQNTIESWSTDDEIDSIKMLEMHEKVLVKAKNSKGKQTPKAEKTLKVGEDTFKFGFQPRVEVGMVKFTMRSDNFRARAWLGVNGSQEINVERNFNTTQSKIFFNYFIDEQKVLSVFDQRLSKHWIFRITHFRSYRDIASFEDPELAPEFQEDNIFQFRYSLQF